MDIPLMELDRWTRGADPDRAAFAAEVDHALQTSGFLMVANHGIAPSWRAELRAVASQFFALPESVRQPYATKVGGRGWLPPGKEANSFYGIDADPDRADMKESFVIGPELPVGDANIDAAWFVPNVWPAEVPELQPLTLRYFDALGELYRVLLGVCEAALDLPHNWFVDRTRRAVHVMNINRYPSHSEVGTAKDGQFRIAPHTDWGTLTILDRQPGYGGLQLQSPSGQWEDAPYVEDAFTINVGDLLGRWTGDRWRSTRHRVLPPPSDAPDEELMSLVAFFEADADVVVEAFSPPIGHDNDYEPVVVGDWLVGRYEAAVVS